MSNQTLKNASVLAFDRKLDPSDALFYAGLWDNRDNVNNLKRWPGIELREKSVRGTISHRLKAKDGNNPAKLDADIRKANLQRVDIATLPPDCDTLKVEFTLRVLNGLGQASACNNVEYQRKLQKVVQGYIQANGLKELAHRYAFNLANGRFLWRNRLGVEAIETQIKCQQGQEVKQFTFNAFDFPLAGFNMPANIQPKLEELAKVIETGLIQEEGYVLLEVVAFVKIGKGQEVFPSQELVLEKGREKGQKSKVLYAVNNIAAIHSQKIGNALRTIDDWYPNSDSNSNDLKPIAVESYGSVTVQGKSYREPKEKVDFYSLLDAWVLKDRVPSIGNQHYVIAHLIRGGVFGDSEKVTKETEE